MVELIRKPDFAVLLIKSTNFGQRLYRICNTANRTPLKTEVTITCVFKTHEPSRPGCLKDPNVFKTHVYSRPGFLKDTNVFKTHVSSSTRSRGLKLYTKMTTRTKGTNEN